MAWYEPAVDLRVSERLEQTNPWLIGRGAVRDAPVARRPEGWIERTQIDAGGLLRPGRAHLVVGPRQAGKSSLAWSVLSTLRRPLFVNLEEPVFRQWCTSPAAFLADVDGARIRPEALFLEEAQHLPDAALFVKGLVDARVSWPVIVTGSASFHLWDRTRESLAGRATRHRLLPFSLAEVAPEGAQSLAGASRRRSALAQMLRIGGYPEAWLSAVSPSPGDKPAAVLETLVQAFVLRDASDLFRVERLDAFTRLLELVARQVGSLVNLSELASLCGVSVGTIDRYLALLEEAHLICRVPPFAGGRRREVTATPKVFFVDIGLRNALLGRLDIDLRHAPDRGAIVEGWVFSELHKITPWRTPVRFWRSRSGAEVDFVLTAPDPGRPADRLLGIEVKAGPLSRPRLSRSARSFIQAYQPASFWVINESLEAQETVAGTPVRWLPHVQLPEHLSLALSTGPAVC